jgi:hypothetical protein
MSRPSQPDDRPTRDDSEVGSEFGLSLTLWVIATLLAAIELVWWWADRIYST